MEFSEFRFKGRTYYHIIDGWCYRQVAKGGSSAYRIFWGPMNPGATAPGYVHAYKGEAAEYVDLPDLESCAAWVAAKVGQRKERKRTPSPRGF
jgi:hypothetical protein